MLNTDMTAYYAKRAATHEEEYANPEWQHDLAVVRNWIHAQLTHRHVLELGCGTGYWTAEVAHVAASVLATDCSGPMIDRAKSKNLPADKVRFALADAFDITLDGLAVAGEAVEAIFAAGWWSHVLREEQDRLMTRLRQQVAQDTLLVLVDHVYVEGSSTSIARTDLQGNTFQIRTLDGERFELLKNFPSDSALRKRFGAHLKDIRIQRLEHFWMLSGRLR